MKYTEGPWSIEEFANETYRIRASIANRKHSSLEESVAIITGTKANADLISASPDMLEALETICDQVTDLNFDQLCLVKNAIRKARGK